MTAQQPTPTADQFPFTMEDLAYWVIKRKDGTIVKYSLLGQSPAPGSGVTYHTPSTSPTYPRPHLALGEWCDHVPFDPIYFDEERNIRLHIADAPGCRKMRDHFDFIIDCGNILNLSTLPDDTLVGDKELCDELLQYCTTPPPVRVLKIDWDDRQAPPCNPQFFTELSKIVRGDILTACQGGHGRSGTSLVCLLMNWIPSYTPYEAICHLRALHCPRAIESKVQHEYIGEVGTFLGRENDIDRVKEVKSFKEAFLALKNPDAEPWKAYLAQLTEAREKRSKK